MRPDGDSSRLAAPPARGGEHQRVDPFRWALENPAKVDAAVFLSAAVLIGLFGTVAIGLQPLWWMPFSLVMFAAGAFGRTRTGLAVGIIAVCAVGHMLLGDPVIIGDVMTFYALYCAAAHGSRAVHVLGVVLGFLGTLVQAAYWAAFALMAADGGVAGAIGAFVGLSITGTITVVAVWAIARLQHARLRQIDLVRERAEQAEREREQRAALAVAAERTRIAREMHDVVAHALSVIIAQADGGRFIAAQSPERAAEVLGTIAGTGRSALADMRSLLGVLRSDEETSFGPQPGPEMLPELAERVRAAGVPVSLEIEGDLEDVPAAQGLTVFRLVQESLTNVMKHGGPGAAADVRITREADRLEITVIDDGQGTDPDSDGAGHGLAGMRERVGAFGGSIQAGPLPGRGYRVHARMPVRPHAGAGAPTRSSEPEGPPR